jgi:hypothetical protein
MLGLIIEVSVEVYDSGRSVRVTGKQYPERGIASVMDEEAGCDHSCMGAAAIRASQGEPQLLAFTTERIRSSRGGKRAHYLVKPQ